MLIAHHDRPATRRDLPKLSVLGRLSQARMWRQYAQDWDSDDYWDRGWVEKILRVPRDECVRRARVNVYLAKRLNRTKKN